MNLVRNVEEPSPREKEPVGMCAKSPSDASFFFSSLNGRCSFGHASPSVRKNFDVSIIDVF